MDRLTLAWVIGLLAAVAYSPMAPLLWLLSLLTVDWFRDYARLFYGHKLAPRVRVIGNIIEVRGVRYAFYEAQPLVDISTSHEKALTAFSSMLSRLTGEVGFYRLKGRLHLRLPVDSSDVLVLRQFFIMRQVNPSQVIGLLVELPW
ncbi:hypothetical protein [Caldivirga sp.]